MSNVDTEFRQKNWCQCLTRTEEKSMRKRIAMVLLGLSLAVGTPAATNMFPAVSAQTVQTGELTNANLKNMMQEVASNLTEYQKGNYILTDDQAPVELLGMQVIDELIKDEVQYYKDIYKERGIKGLMESL